jgi:hypothetical protein|tara:strand:+ start:49 stop:231 length:183 start_codon:yes stop_codon:yes gene_type:complete
MKMKKISKSRWAMLLFVIVAIVVLFNVTGCSVLTDQFEKAKGLVIETPECDLSCIEEVRG